ncbi:MAG: helix-turn-helix domain-containing protein [Halobacteriales archaeon]
MSQGQTGCPDGVPSPTTERTGGCEGSNETLEESRSTRVVLELAPDGDCFMDDLAGAIIDVEADYNDGICKCDVTVCECQDEDGVEKTDGSGDCEVVHKTAPICDCCPGVIFSEYGCVPRILDRKDGTFVIATYVSSVSVVSDLVAELRGVCSRVEVRSLVNTDACDGSNETREVDLTDVTAKQRQALALAVEAGYYDTPQTTSLEELAEEFEISPSALSQRLARAEGTLLGQIFGDE